LPFDDSPPPHPPPFLALNSWAFAAVNSRSFRLRGAERPPSLVPVIDLCNHAFPLFSAPRGAARGAVGGADGGVGEGEGPRADEGARPRHRNCEVFPVEDPAGEDPTSRVQSGGKPALGALLRAGPDGVKAGEELLVSYGNLSNDELLLDYGPSK